MRGEFIRGDGLVVPNNISKAGAALILAAALRNDVPTLFAALVTGTPSPTMTSADTVEPTIGLNGYTRVAMPRSNVGWPVQGFAGDEAYIESETLLWSGSGAGYDQPIQRLAILGTNTYNAANPIYAMSAPLPIALTIVPATPLNKRQFKYRIYL